MRPRGFHLKITHTYTRQTRSAKWAVGTSFSEPFKNPIGIKRVSRPNEADKSLTFIIVYD